MDDLPQRCRELLEWHRSGILADGRLRALAATYKDTDEGERLARAERDTVQSALRVVAAGANSSAPYG